MINLETIYRGAPANPGAHEKLPMPAKQRELIAGITGAYAQTEGLDIPKGLAEACPGACDPDGIVLVAARSPFGHDSFNSTIRVSDPDEIVIVEGLIKVIMGRVQTYEFLASDDRGQTAARFFPSKRTWDNLLDILAERTFEPNTPRNPLPYPRRMIT